mgnify:CR=1 FL=1
MSQIFDCIASVVVYDTSPQVLLECVNAFLDTKLKVKKTYIYDINHCKITIFLISKKPET